MSLRTSLLLRVLLMSLPLFLAAHWLRREWARGSEAQHLIEVALDAFENGGRERFERAPERFGGALPFGRERRHPPAEGRRGPPIFLWVYDPEFGSANPRAPRFPPDLCADLKSGDDETYRFRAPGEGPPVQVGLRLQGAAAPGAFALIERRDPLPPAGAEPGPRPDGRRPDAPHPGGRGGPSAQVFWWQAGVLTLILLCAVTFAAWPIVRRIRRLTTAVRHSAAERYLSDVPSAGRDELSELAGAFNDAARNVRATIARLQDQERALRDFLTNTTHDVMHPLSVLQGHLGSLRRGLETGKPADAVTLAACQEEAHFVAALVHNLTAAARLQSGVAPLDLRTIDLRPVVERAAARHHAFAASRGQSLEIGVPGEELSVRADMTLMEQAVSNLVHNAVRHNTTGKHVAVLLERSAAGFELQVLDDGPGVTPEELARLTERNFRGTGAWLNNPDGLGIGLAIVREVVARHAFELEFRLREGGGLIALVRGSLATTPSESRKDS